MSPYSIYVSKYAGLWCPHCTIKKQYKILLLFYNRIDPQILLVCTNFPDFLVSIFTVRNNCVIVTIIKFQIPFDRNRVILTPDGQRPDSTYINASFIEGYHNDESFIITQVSKVY